jgi:hypothetical protein
MRRLVAASLVICLAGLVLLAGATFTSAPVTIPGGGICWPRSDEPEPDFCAEMRLITQPPGLRYR